MTSPADFDRQQAQATRDELNRYLTAVGERLSGLRNVLVSDPLNPATLGRLDAHIAVMQAVLGALGRLDHRAEIQS